MSSEGFASDQHVTEASHYALGGEPTQTIDLQSLFTNDPNLTQVFDLRQIESTSFGKLLDALPVPVLLVDKWFLVVFANQSCEKLSTRYREIRGARFTDLLPNLDDSARAVALRSKTTEILEKVLADRNPKRAEAILEIGGQKIWARLNLRSVRLASDRHIMVILEDITSERANQRVSQKDEQHLRESLKDFKAQVRDLARSLSETRRRLQQEIAAHQETKNALRTGRDQEERPH